VYEQVRQAVHTPTPPQPSAAGGSGADAGAAEKRGGKKEAVAAGVSGGGAEFAFALLARAVMANQQHHDAVPPRVRQTVHVSVDKRYNQHGGQPLQVKAPGLSAHCTVGQVCTHRVAGGSRVVFSGLSGSADWSHPPCYGYATRTVILRSN